MFPMSDFSSSNPSTSSSPIYSLPTEILSDIFGLLSENDLSDPPSQGCELSKPQPLFSSRWKIQGLVLENVCRHWRSVSLGTPSLWSNLRIPLTDEDRDRLQVNHVTAAVDVLLRRTINNPIDLRLDIIDNFSFDSPVWLALSSSCRRWRSLSVRAPAFDHLDFLQFFLKTQTPFPLLECFDSEISQNTYSVLDHAPRLTSFCYSGREVFESPLPWDRITRVYLTDQEYVGHVSAMLSRFSSAQKVKVHLTTDLEDFYVTYPNDITLPEKCHTLVLDATGYTGFSSVLSFFKDSPTLTDLTLIDVHGGISSHFAGPGKFDVQDTVDDFHFKSFIERSQCNLTTLTLQNVYITSDSLIRILRLLPSLRHLSIHEFRLYLGHLPTWYSIPELPPLLSPSVLFHLRSLDSNESPDFPLLPQLVSFELKGRFGAVSDADIVDLVVSRASRGLELFRIHMEDCCIDSKEFDRLKPLLGPTFRAEATGTRESDGDGMDRGDANAW